MLISLLFQLGNGALTPVMLSARWSAGTLAFRFLHGLCRVLRPVGIGCMHPRR